MTYCNTPAQLPCCARVVGCLPCLNKDIFKEPIPFYLKLMTLLAVAATAKLPHLQWREVLSYLTLEASMERPELRVVLLKH